MSTEALQPFNPLPHRYLTDAPGVGGTIKQRPEDFLVDEQPLYQPAGEGEHIYVFVEKRDTSHFELINALQQHFQVSEEAIGYAGMKDRIGVTRQLVSIHLPEHQCRDAGQNPLERPFEHDRIRILWMDRHHHKLRRGHLAGNRFSIRIRDVDPLHAPRVHEALKLLEKTGVPNHFGYQRFGYRRNNHILGAAMLRQQWKAILAELLGSGGSPFPEHQDERRKLFDEGRFSEALRHWSRSDRSERAALSALAQGRSEKDAVLAVGKNTWSFWISALQSAIFNRVLDERLSRGLFDSLLEGDVCWKHDSRRTFVIAPASGAEPSAPADDGVSSDVDAMLGAADSELNQRLSRFEISPSGPLWGTTMRTSPSGTEVARMEERAVEEAGLELRLFRSAEDSPFAPVGARRPLREQLSNPEIEAGLDEHGRFIRVAFDLPRGVYATIVLRELMKLHEWDLKQ